MSKNSIAKQVANKRFENEKPQPPAHLADIARDTWEEMVDALPASHFARQDLPLLAEYCEVVRVIRITRDEWNKNPTPYITLPSGNTKQHPCLTTLNNHQAILSTLATKLRICPNSRLTNNQAGHEKCKPVSQRKGLLFEG